MPRPLLVAAMLACAVTPTAAFAQAQGPTGGPVAIGEWTETDGARVRVLLGAADADGWVKGVVEVDLEPGWKTYWIAPGPNGIPPRFEATGSNNVDLVAVLHPAPRRFSDGYGTSVGYDGDVAFALDLALRDAEAPARLRLNGFIGVCEEVCVPLPIRMEGDVPTGRSVPLEVTLPLGRARMALPLKGEPGLLTASVDGDGVTVTGLPDGAEVFVAPPDGLMLGEGIVADGSWRAPVERGEPTGTMTVIVREGAIETEHSVPIAPPRPI